MRLNALSLIISILLMAASSQYASADPDSFRFLEEDVDAFDDILHHFDHQSGWKRDPIDHEGPIEMIQDLKLGKRSAHDAVWSLSPMWLDLGDQSEILQHRKTIARSPVVWGVKKSKAEKWGWLKTPPTLAEMFQKVNSGKLRGLMMASASHCTSGALEYLSMLYIAAGAPDKLKLQHLNDPQVQETVRTWLKAIERSDDSSVWITDDLIHKYDEHDAMINFQAEIIRANQELKALGREPLVQIVPQEGTMMAQAVLGFIPHENRRVNRKKERFFKSLQRYLSTPKTQEKLRSLGWLSGVTSQLNAKVFNPRLGLQASLNLFPLPDIKVIERALKLYQTKLRKPSLTIFVLDVSGSMRGERLKQLKEAMHQVLDPQIQQRYLLQPTPEDVTVVITFSQGVRHHWVVRGDDPRDFRDLDRKIAAETAGGGTQLFSALTEAYEEIEHHPEFARGHLPAIVLLTDGKPSKDPESWRSVKRLIRSVNRDVKVPVHPVLFGDSDDRLMREIAEFTEGHLIDAHEEDLAHAFRQLQGGH